MADLSRGGISIAIAGLSILLGACSISYTSMNGERRIFGFGDFAVEDPSDAETAGYARNLQTLGFALIQGPESITITLGYIDYRAAVIHNDSTIVGNPVDLACYGDPVCRAQQFALFAEELGGESQ